MMFVEFVEELEFLNQCRQMEFYVEVSKVSIVFIILFVVRILSSERVLLLDLYSV